MGGEGDLAVLENEVAQLLLTPYLGQAEAVRVASNILIGRGDMSAIRATPPLVDPPPRRRGGQTPSLGRPTASAETIAGPLFPGRQRRCRSESQKSPVPQ